VATANDINRVLMAGGLAPGTFTVIRTIANTVVAENGGWFFVCTCIDKRT
jgi:6-phosphofructokinase